MLISYQNDEKEFQKVFLSDIWPLGVSDPPKVQCQIGVGVITEIIYSNDRVCCFNIQDVTRSIRAETFKDNYNDGFTLPIGSIIQFKCDFLKNHYGEYSLKIFKIRFISFNEELLHYLEVEQRKKIKECNPNFHPWLFDEEQKMIDDYTSSVVENKFELDRETLYKRMFSTCFFFFLENVGRIEIEGGVIHQDEIWNRLEFKKMANSFENIEDFCRFKMITLNNLKASGLIEFEDDFVYLNTGFFFGFEKLFLESLGLCKKKTFDNRIICEIINDLIPENQDCAICVELVHSFMKKLEHSRKIVIADKFKGWYCLTDFCD